MWQYILGMFLGRAAMERNWTNSRGEPRRPPAWMVIGVIGLSLFTGPCFFLVAPIGLWILHALYASSD